MELMNENAAAKYLGLSVKTLQSWRVKEVGPEYVKMGAAVRYAKEILDLYVKQNIIRPEE